jgi:hypothetical protein
MNSRQGRDMELEKVLDQMQVDMEIEELKRRVQKERARLNVLLSEVDLIVRRKG